MREIGGTDRDGDLVSEASEDLMAVDEPTEIHPHLWWRYLCDMDGQVPRKIMSRLHVAWSLIPNPCPGSMGEFLKNVGTAALAAQNRGAS